MMIVMIIKVMVQGILTMKKGVPTRGLLRTSKYTMKNGTTMNYVLIVIMNALEVNIT